MNARNSSNETLPSSAAMGRRSVASAGKRLGSTLLSTRWNSASSAALAGGTCGTLYPSDSRQARNSRRSSCSGVSAGCWAVRTHLLAAVLVEVGKGLAVLLELLLGQALEVARQNLQRMSHPSARPACCRHLVVDLVLDLLDLGRQVLAQAADVLQGPAEPGAGPRQDATSMESCECWLSRMRASWICLLISSSESNWCLLPLMVACSQ